MRGAPQLAAAPVAKTSSVSLVDVSLSMVMLNGRLYDAKTLNEIGNHPRARLPFWFEEPERGTK